MESKKQAPKVLVVGAINGHLNEAFKKIAKHHSKINFAVCIVVGDLFGDGSYEDEATELQSLLNESLAVPLTTYFTTGNRSLPTSVIEKLDRTGEICSNLFFLGRKATQTTSDGIKIVALGGKLVQNEGSVTKALGKYDPLYMETDAKGLHGAHSAHILITNQWPADIANRSNIQLPELLRSDEGVPCISSLCSVLKPRYHFSSSPDAMFEREPFVHPVEYGSLELESATRFTSLASVTHPAKQWLSAFALDPMINPGKPVDATSTPFTDRILSNGKKRPAQSDQQQEYSRFSGGDGYAHRSAKRHKGRKDQGKEQCFFCLNNNEFETHMVASIGTDSILTVPKGPLPLPDTFPALSFPGHVLIIPLHHAEDDVVSGGRPRQEVDREFAEMQRYRTALISMIQAQGDGKLGAVCWDANRSGIRHMHWQFMAAPIDLVEKGLVEAAFKLKRETLNYPPFQTCSADSQLEIQSDYFRVWIWKPSAQSKNPVEAADEAQEGVGSDGVEKSMFFPIPANERFNIWFGREVMATLLRLENRVNWARAVQDMQDEETDVAGFKKDFALFDFAMLDE